jgi:predicted ATPase
MKNTKKIIITGAPRSGKTITIQLLHQNGYNTVEEPVANIIRNIMSNEQISPDVKQSFIHFNAQYNEFYQKFLSDCYNTFLENFNKVEEGKITFFDRGIPDLFIIAELLGISVPEELFKSSMSIRYYPTVFFFEMLPIDIVLSNLHERPMFDLSVVQLIEKRIIEIYTKYGYEIIRIPIATPAERVNFLMEQIKLMELETK